MKKAKNETIAAEFPKQLARRRTKAVENETPAPDTAIMKKVKRSPSRQFVYLGDRDNRRRARILLQNWDREKNGVPKFCSYDPGFDVDATIEECSRRLLAMLAAGKLKKPHLLQALALDLVFACFPDSCYPPEALRQLLSKALGLPDEHKPGEWDYLALWGRGRDSEALARAHKIDLEYYLDSNPGKRMTLYKLEREVRAAGFNTSKSTLRTWRSQSYFRQPGDEDYLPPFPAPPTRRDAAVDDEVI
jgi:hypothetical protein